MKNKTLKSILIGCLFLFALSSHAQIKILTVPDTIPDGELPILGTIINGGNLVPESDYPAEYVLGADCVEYFSFTVLVANLGDQTVGNTKSLSLPSFGYEPMALRLTIGHESGCIELDNFEPYDTPEGYNLYQSTVFVPVNLRNFCKANKFGNVINPSFSVEWFAEIIKADGNDCDGEYELYPFCDYTDPGSLYPCDIFDLGANCPLSPGICDNESLTTFDGEFYIECGDCKSNGIIISDVPSLELPFDKDRVKRTSSNPENEFLMLPNPFNSLLNIQWLGQQATPTEVTLRDVNGRILQRWIPPADGADHPSIQIDTKQLPAGMYIATIKDDQGGHYTEKIIKH
ncbi:MAG: T9SS type A sorting domain-containing protein [Bacteroidota bacterium]